jgi:adenosine deaminase
MIEDFANENVVYLEIRTTPRVVPGQMTKRSYVETVLDAINNHPHKNITVKLLLSINRGETNEQAMETVNLAIEYKNSGVVGIDLSGNPSVELELNNL